MKTNGILYEIAEFVASANAKQWRVNNYRIFLNTIYKTVTHRNSIQLCDITVIIYLIT